jgi:hypothetical protein
MRPEVRRGAKAAYLGDLVDRQIHDPPDTPQACHLDRSDVDLA